MVIVAQARRIVINTSMVKVLFNSLQAGSQQANSQGA